jgi:hypothetical protein
MPHTARIQTLLHVEDYEANSIAQFQELLPRVIATTVDTQPQSVLLLVTICGSKQGPQIETENEATRPTFTAKKHVNGWVGVQAIYLATDRATAPSKAVVVVYLRTGNERNCL